MIQGIRGIRSCSMENPTFEEIRYISLYSPYIRPCCELMRGTVHQYSPKKHEPGDICKMWCSKPVFQLQKYCDIIKICTFRPLLFVPHCDPSKKCHDPSCQFDELNMEKLCQIEILEDITELVKKFADDQLFISGILTTETDLEKGIIRTSEVLEWMKYADHIGILQKLRKLADYCCWSILKLFFSAYKYYISKVILEDYNLVEAFESSYCDNCMMNSENMKKRGNEAFAKKKLDTAITFYTKAIELWPENHFLYGNRALCFLRIGQYWKALCDGKRAIILKPCWPKGHYRFCDALSFLGEHRKALEANERGQDQCRENPEGIKGLIEQHQKLKNQMEEARGIKQNKYRLKKQLSQKNSSEYVSFGNQESKKETKNHNENKKLCDSHHHPCQQKQTTMVGNTKTRENIDHLSVFTAEVSENPQKQRSQMDDSEKMKEQLNLKTDSKKVVEKYNFQCGNVQQGDVILSLEMLKTYMKNGSTSLMNQCFHSAEQSFALPLNMLDPSQLQCLNLALVDYVVIIYGYASALLGIGQPEELSKAKYHFDKIIEQYQKVRFNCLAHYGIGKVYLRQNRFSEALDQFMKSKTMVNLKIVPGVLTWPTTSVVIKETRSETLQVILEDCITECKFPPKPDALCCYQQCQAHKIQIYFNDPDFKGFIRIVCCERCLVEFHLSCWKKVKAAKYCDKNDKDILQETCFTPDCSGLISKITVFSSSGIVKCEFEHKIITKNPPRPVLKQKCSSFRKLQIKQEKKLRRKFIKEAVSFRNLEVFHGNNIVAKDDSFKGNIPNNFFVKDTVLQLIGRYTKTIQDGIHDVFKFLVELLSWWVLSEEDYALFSTSCQSSAEIMDQLISLLIAKNDRVKTRVFVHVVSEFEEVDPKLHDWMKHLDNNGLKATEFFLSEYITYILQIDFNSVAVFWNEKYGIKLSRTFTCLSEDVDEIIKYLEELSFMELRCLVWLLEENRQSFPFLHQCLDDYFDNLDNPFIVLRKEYTEKNTSNNAIKVKNKNRKKSKESKAILVVSDGVGTITQEEDNILSEENTLSFMNPHEPFRIPDDLHEQVVIFEALYNTASSNNSYQRILDSYPDPTCESLYDYFSQILEEHGPMEIDNPLLVGEYEDFPADTRRIVENAGGLKSFLLGSLRFVMVDDLIGLMKHAVMLQENAELIEIEENNYSESQNCQKNNFHSISSLNPTAKEFKPLSFINKPYISTSPNNLEYVTASHSSFSPFASSYSFSSQTTDTAPVASISLSPTIPDDYAIILNKIHSEYVNERLPPVFTQVPLMPDISKQTNYIYADYNTYLDTDSEEATYSKCNVGKFITGDQVHTFQNSPCVAVKSDIHTYKDNPDQIEDHCNDAECSSVTKIITENKSLARNNPHSRMIAVQVDQELTDAGVNTLPLHPYESQQGDMLRVEKEYHVLQKQLKEAIEKYEQLKCRSSKETSILEEELSLLIEGNKLSKRELDWFHEDAEMNFKKWQQEKKEKQEGLKAGKNKVRKLIETNEIYMKNIDEKDKQYKAYLDEFLEISNRFECEKVKMEELIKKSQDYKQECVKRAIAAEVSVLENWKEKEFYKLCRKSTNAKANLKYLKFMTSHSTTPQSKLQIDSWESLISNIGEEKKKTESQFEERIYIIKNGALLNSITPVETADIQPPTGLSLATPEKSPINDPAIIMCSSAAPHLFATFSNVNDSCSLSSKAKTHTGNKNPDAPSDKDIGELPSEFRQSSLSDKVCLPQSLGNSERHLQNIQPQHNILEEPAGAAGLDCATILNKPILGKLSENIIDQLRIIFPYHTSSDLENFIKEVNVKNRNKLSTDEYLNRVTEFILDHPNTKKVLSSSRKNEKLSSCTLGENGNRTQKVLNTLVQSKAKSKTANEKKNKTRLPPQSNQMPWKNIGETSKSKWKKSNDATDNDPCVICHEELTSSLLHVLDCGHRFHKLCIGPWIKEHSTCPTCRRHILLREDYPELPGRNKKN